MGLTHLYPRGHRSRVMSALRRVAFLGTAALLLAGCSQPDPEITYRDVPAPTPSELSPPEDLQDPDVLAQFFVSSIGDIDPASQTTTTRINQMKNELVIHPASEGCSEGILEGNQMDALRDDGVEISVEGDIEDVTDDPVDKPTQFAHSYRFTVQATDSNGNPSEEHLNGGQMDLIAYIIAERNSEDEPFMITECSIQDAPEEVIAE